MKMFLSALCLLGLTATQSFGQRIDLNDISIQGELHNDNRLRFYQRNRARLDTQVRIPKDFRRQIRSGHPQSSIFYDLEQARKDSTSAPSAVQQN